MKPAILICGPTGTGKSSIVNFCLRKPEAEVGNNAESVRKGFPPPKYENDAMLFYDCDGYEIGSADVYINKLIRLLMENTGIHLVWYTINAAAHRVTDFDRKIVDFLSQYVNVFILLTKIDDCNEDELWKFHCEVFSAIPETPIYKVSTDRKIQNYTDWNLLVESTTKTLTSVIYIKCPLCSSRKIHIEKKRFRKRMLLLGWVGIIAEGIRSLQTQYVCEKCGCTWG